MDTQDVTFVRRFSAGSIGSIDCLVKTAPIPEAFLDDLLPRRSVQQHGTDIDAPQVPQSQRLRPIMGMAES
jgi:hypothetical protein